MTSPASATPQPDFLSLVRTRDHQRLQKMWRDIQSRQQQGQPYDRLQSKLEQLLEASKQQVEERGKAIPKVDYPEHLPVVERREEIAETIAKHQVVILAGETGSGKTTQLPKICLELGRGTRGLIGHTQPRRLAARSVANRIAEELHTELGNLVGYQVRFTDQVSDNSAIKLMTDGILLAEIQNDRYLSRYDTLIIDEAHERSLNIDFLLGYLKQLLLQRPDLKLIVTSATIDVERFSKHFDDAPVLEVSGRTYPVEVRYREPVSDGEESLSSTVIDALEEIDTLDKQGDILVFLSGERDIRELSRQIRQRNFKGTEVLPLYARLSNAEQNKVFDQGKRRGRRIVLATNVAETSLTVPGIRYVIDPGYARISRYSYRTKVQRLPVEAISQASANQRKGRCGRVAEGICIRLYSEEDFLNRPEFTDPEIRRTNLAAVILQMLHLRLGNIEHFPFIEPPDGKMIRDGYKLLEELGAVDNKDQLTTVGRQLARLPVDPRIGRMVLAAIENGSLRELLIIASALSVQDPRERPADKQQAADQMHRRFWDEKSDFTAYINLWDYYETQRQELSQSQLRKLCKKEYLSFLKMREWRDIHHQLSLAVRQLGGQRKGQPNDQPVKQSDKSPASYELVHKALLSGLLSHIAQWQEDREYLGARNRKMQIFPGSSQSKKKPKWLVAAEVVETSRVFARTVADIEPEWALGINNDLLKYHHYEPHWQQRTGRVVAFERISLYGLPVRDKHKVHYGPIDAKLSREIMIRSALVENRNRERLDFQQANQKLLHDLEQLEAKFRRRDLLASEQVLFDFYAERIPDHVNTMKSLKSWLKKHPESNEQLKIERSQLMLRELESSEQAQFPDQLEWDDMQFQLSYHFEPGHPRDGVSMTVPVGLINRLPKYRFEWLVPGLLREKCMQLVKNLPKTLRKNFVPVPDYVDRALEGAEAQDRPLTEFLAERLQKLAGLRLDNAMWQDVSVDDYYRLNFVVVDAEAKVLTEGRDQQAVLKACKGSLTEVVSTGDAAQAITKTGLTRWDFGELAEEVNFKQAGVGIRAYPALVSQGDTVSLELLDYPEQAELASRKGLVNLMRLNNAQQVRYLRKQFLKGNELALQLASCGLDRDVLVEDFVNAVFAQAILNGRAIPRTSQAFDQYMQAGKGGLVDIANEYEKIIGNALAFYAKVTLQLKQLDKPNWAYARKDIEQQLAQLIYPGFLLNTELEVLKHYPRYCKAIHIRLERISGQYQKDKKHTAVLRQMLERIETYTEEKPELLLVNAELQKYRWMLEEYRVSLFAQSLGTNTAVSEKRLLQQWQRFEDSLG